MLCRLIAPKWFEDTHPEKRSTIEGFLSDEQIAQHNLEGYNVYYWPNSPSQYIEGQHVNGTHIDQFQWVFVDYDLKDKKYQSKEHFISTIIAANIPPTCIVDSGNGIHVYWQVTDLDAKSYLRLVKRLIRRFSTDEATGTLAQLMRVPGTLNTKKKDAFVECTMVYEDNVQYTCEQLDKLLPPITADDEKKCQQHYDKTYNIDRDTLQVSDTMPKKFGELLHKNHEAKELWSGSTDDRSKSDYRLGHIMFANGFTKDEAATVLANSAKALQRAPIHRLSYAQNIIEKIWTYEEQPAGLDLSESVEQILRKGGDAIKGTAFRCSKLIDNTEHGFRLGHVIGLIAGSGVGKTSFALNMFKWFAENNPDYHHFFVPLEQPGNELADRWQTLCGDDVSLHKKVHILSNYDSDGNFRHLSFDEIKEYIKKWQSTNGIKIGCVVIDHIGALKKKTADNENQDLMNICHAMKAFAIETNTLLVMQSQASRQKAGIGDLELDKDAAYGTVFFEAYCDFLITLWQPLKRCHHEDVCPTTTAFKFCKIRHKKPKKDVLQEDVAYYLFYDSTTGRMRNLTQAEKDSFNFYIARAINLRKADKKLDIIKYQSVPITEEINVRNT